MSTKQIKTSKAQNLSKDNSKNPKHSVVNIFIFNKHRLRFFKHIKDQGGMTTLQFTMILQNIRM